ncbi:MAG: AEC family transporter, partial [Burkholderiaceae bacterium]
MHSIVLSALLPVAVLIALGFALGRTRWIGPRPFAQLSEIAFWVLTPAVLFRTMSRVHLEQLDLRPAAAYILTLA